MPGNYNIGTAKGVIELDASSLARATGALTAVGVGLTSIGLLAIAGFGYVINKAATFEQVMSGAQSALGATEAQMQIVKKTALELGANSIYGATNVARAIEQLAYAGLSIQEIVGGAAKATIDLAQASGGLISLDDAGKTVVNTMRTFGLGVKDAVHIADELAGAANKSTIDLNDMVTSFRYVGPVAHTAGLGIDDVAQALAILGDRGIRGSTAGTSLRGVLLGLVAPSTKAQGVLEDLGIITADGANIMFDSAGKMKSLAEVSQILQDHTKGLSKEQKIAAFNAIFQRRALASALVLAEQGAKGFAHYKEEIAAGGSASDIAAVRLNNLKGDVSLLHSALETTVIQAGTPFQNMLRTIVQHLTDLIKVFGRLKPWEQSFLLWTLLIGGTLLTAAGSVALFSSMILRMYKAFSDLGPALKAVQAVWTAFSEALLANPVFLIIAAIVALIIIFVLLYTHVQGFRDAVDTAWNAVKDAVLAAWNFIYPILVEWVHWLGENIPKAAQAVWKALQQAWEGIKSGLSTAWAIVQPILSALVSFFKTAGGVAADWGEAIGHQAELFGRYFSKNIMPTVAALGELFAAVFNRISSTVQTTWTILKPVFDFMVKMFKIELTGAITIARAAISFFVAVIRDMIPIVTSGFQLIIGLISAAWGPLWEGVKTVVSVAFAEIQGLFNIFVAVIRTLWTPFWNLVKRIVTIAWSFIKEYIDAAMQFIRGIIEVITGIITGKWGKVWDGIKHILAGVWDAMVAVVRAGLELFKAIITAGLDAAVRFFKNVPKAVVTAIGNVVTTLLSKGDDLIRGLLRGILQAWEDVFKFVNGLPDKILNLLKDFGTLLIDIGKALMHGLLEGIKTGLGDVKDFVLGIGEKLISWKGPPSHDKVLLTQNGELIMTGLISGMKRGMPGLQRFLEGASKVIQATQPSLQANFAGVGGSQRVGGGLPQGVNTSSATSPVHVVEKGDTVHVDVHQTPATPEEIVNAYFWGKQMRK